MPEDSSRPHSHTDENSDHGQVGVPPAFDAFHRRCLQGLLDRHGRDLDPVLLTAVAETLGERVATLSLRVLIGRFHAFLRDEGLPARADSDRGMRLFGERLADKAFCESILQDAPVLAELLQTSARRTCRFARELRQAWTQDRDELARQALVVTGSDLTRVQFGQGDTHNGGRTVAVITLSDGGRIVFKPRPAVLEATFTALVAAIANDLTHNLTGCLPRTLGREAHSWQAYVAGSDLDSVRADAYFYRFGALAALTAAIGSTDLHHENVIADAGMPVIIDSETLLQPGPDGAGGLAVQLGMQIELAATSTMLLPSITADSVFDVVISGIGVPWEQVSQKKYFMPVYPTADACRVEHRSTVLVHQANVVHVDGAPADPLDFIAPLTRGYHDCLTAMRRRREHLASILTSMPEGRIRTVLRPTDVYAQFLDASSHPDYLRDPAQRHRLFGLLSTPPSVQPAAEGPPAHHTDHTLPPVDTFTLDRERLALYDGDIPYFDVGLHRAQLGAGGQLSGPMTMLAPVDYALRRLSRFTSMPDVWHDLVLESSFAELNRPGHPPRFWRDSAFATLLDGEPSDIDRRFVDMLEQLGTWGVCDNGEQGVSWLSGLGQPGVGTFSAGAAQGLHDLGGVVAYLNARSPDRLSRAAAQGFRELFRVTTSSSGEPLSVFTGPATSLLVLGEAPDHDLRTEVARLCFVADPEPSRIDVIGGLAGLLLCYSAATNVPDSSAVLGAGLDVLDRFDRSRLSGAPTALAHGELGIVWAQARAADAVGDARTRTLALDRASVILARRNQWPHSTGWCTGTAGMLLIATDLCELGLPVPVRLIDDLVEHCQRLPSGPIDLSVCHGLSGVVRALLYADASSARRGQGLGAVARELFDRGRERARTDGWTLGAAGHTALLGYHLGWAGFADTAARLAGRRTSEPLALRSPAGAGLIGQLRRAG